MGIFKVKSQLADLGRLHHILGIVFESGGGVLIGQLNLTYMVPLKNRWRHFWHKDRLPEDLLSPKPAGFKVSGSVLRETFEKLGPTYIKLGQVLSLRPDIVGEDLAKELAKLQSHVAPVPYSEARDILKKELGAYPEQIFADFDRKPVAAASLSQVYRAYLPDGSKVAIKVQRPGVKDVIEADIHILFHLAQLIEHYIPESRDIGPVRIVSEFADWTLRELDFAVEGHNADRFRFMYREDEHIKIPKIYWELTTRRVLTMEFIDGLPANDIQGMEQLGIDCRAVATHGVDALLKQFLYEGFFHADPHPGNYFVLPGDVLCFQDFGMVGYLTRDQRNELVSCFTAYANKDSENFIKHTFHLVTTDDQSDVNGFSKDISEILNEFFYSENTPSIAWSFFKILNRAPQRHIRVPADLSLFAKALVTTEALGRTLYPDFDINAQIQPLVGQVMQEYLNPLNGLKALQSDIFDYSSYVKKLPEETMKLLSKIQKGEMGVKIDTQELYGIKDEFDRQNDVRILGVIAAALLLLTVYIRYAEGLKTFLGFPLSTVASFVTLILITWLIVKVKIRPST